MGRNPFWKVTLAASGAAFFVLVATVLGLASPRLMTEAISNRSAGKSVEAFNVGTVDSPSYAIVNGVSGDIGPTGVERNLLVPGAIGLDSMGPDAFWSTETWGECSATCGEGVSERIAVCIGRNETTVEDSRCPGERPAMSRPCFDYFGCTFAWTQWADWTGCTEGDCGIGTMSRERQCLRQDGESATATDCGGGEASETQPCQPCAECRYAYVFNGASHQQTDYFADWGGYWQMTWDGVAVSIGASPAWPYARGGYLYYPGAHKGTHSTSFGLFDTYGICRIPQ